MLHCEKRLESVLLQWWVQIQRRETCHLPIAYPIISTSQLCRLCRHRLLPITFDISLFTDVPNVTTQQSVYQSLYASSDRIHLNNKLIFNEIAQKTPSLRPPDVSRRSLYILPLNFFLTRTVIAARRRIGAPLKVYQWLGPRCHYKMTLKHLENQSPSGAVVAFL